MVQLVIVTCLDVDTVAGLLRVECVDMGVMQVRLFHMFYYIVPKQPSRISSIYRNLDISLTLKNILCHPRLHLPSLNIFSLVFDFMYFLPPPAFFPPFFWCFPCMTVTTDFVLCA